MHVLHKLLQQNPSLYFIAAVRVEKRREEVECWCGTALFVRKHDQTWHCDFIFSCINVVCAVYSCKGLARLRQNTCIRGSFLREAFLQEIHVHLVLSFASRGENAIDFAYEGQKWTWTFGEEMTNGKMSINRRIFISALRGAMDTKHCKKGNFWVRNWDFASLCIWRTPTLRPGSPLQNHISPITHDCD